MTDDQSVQMQIADKVRIEVARASIGGYQGQEPVVQPELRRAVIHVQESSLEIPRHRRRDGLAVAVVLAAVHRRSISGSTSRAACTSSSVKTDDALRVETETTVEQLQDALKTAKITGRPASRSTG